jgi:hypothetical protein
MIQLFRRILCPIDFSEHSLAALNVALKVALQNDAKLYLLNVVPLPAGEAGFQPVPMDPYPHIGKERQEELAKLGHELLPAAVRLRDAGGERRSGRAGAQHRAHSGCGSDRDGHTWAQRIQPPGPGQCCRTGCAGIADSGPDSSFEGGYSEGGVI